MAMKNVFSHMMYGLPAFWRCFINQEKSFFHHVSDNDDADEPCDFGNDRWSCSFCWLFSMITNAFRPVCTWWCFVINNSVKNDNTTPNMRQLSVKCCWEKHFSRCLLHFWWHCVQKIFFLECWQTSMDILPVIQMSMTWFWYSEDYVIHLDDSYYVYSLVIAELIECG